MTRFLCGTDGLIAAACSWRAHHQRTHAEVQRRALAEANWPDTPTVQLTAQEVWEAMRAAERLGVTGGQTYDAFIAHSALKAGASTIVTWNVRHFARFAGQIAVESPP